MFFILLESPLWLGINEGDLKKIRLKMREIMKIQLNYKKWTSKEKFVR